MKASTIHHQSYRWLAATGVALALTGSLAAQEQAAATAVAVAQNKNQNVVAASKNVVITNADGGEQHTVQLRVEDGKVTVIRDGKEIPHAELHQDDGQIIITDKDGKRVETIELKMQPGSMYRFSSESGKSSLFKTATPKVMLGIQMAEPGPALERHLQLKKGKATMIIGLHEGLPAFEAGLKEYDIITQVNESDSADRETISKVLAEKEPGDVVKLVVIQEGKPKSVNITLVPHDAKALAQSKVIGAGPNHGIWSGVFEQFSGDEHMHFFNPSQDMGRIYIAPEGPAGGRIEMLKPQIEQWQSARPEIKRWQESTNVEQQLERLDERMAELEQLLQRLIDRQAKDR